MDSIGETDKSKDLKDVKIWYRKFENEVPRLRDDTSLFKTPSFVVLVDLLYGGKKPLTPLEACIVALCNGKFTVKEIVGIYVDCFDESFDKMVNFVSKTFTAYRDYIILEKKRRLDDNRYRAADFIYDTQPVNPERFEPYPVPVEGVFAVTNRCNMRCIYCYRSAGEAVNNELTTEELLNLIDQSGEMGIVRGFITGGEPFLHPDIITIINRLITNGIFPYISTNGVLVSPDIVSKLKDMGVKIVQISLDAVSPNVFEEMVGSNIDERIVENAIALLVEAGIIVAVKAVITRLNVDEVEKLIDRCLELGVNRLSTEGFGLSFGGRGNEDLIIEEKKVKLLEALIEEKREEYRGRIYLEGFNRASIWDDFDDIITCGGMVSAFVLQPNGDIVLCENLGNVPELVFGNIREEKLSDIWASDKVLAFLNPDESIVDPLCRNCTYFRDCRTGCYNRSLMESGKLWDADPFCWRIRENNRSM